jgi:hypothetical protein
MSLDSASLRRASACGAALRAPVGSHFESSAIVSPVHLSLMSLDSASLDSMIRLWPRSSLRLGGFAARFPRRAYHAPLALATGVTLLNVRGTRDYLILG